MNKLIIAVAAISVVATPALASASLVYAKVRGAAVVDSYVKYTASEAACEIEKASVKQAGSKAERIFTFCTEDPSVPGAAKASKVFGENLPSKDDGGIAMPFALVAFYADKKSGELGPALVKYFPTVDDCSKHTLTVPKPGKGIVLHHFCTVNGQ